MTKICKWGNSLGLRLPKETAANAGLLAGTRVRVRLLDNGCILITPLGTSLMATAMASAIPPTKAPAKW